MRTMATSFSQSGWRFTQLDREGMVALFRKARRDGTQENFEVVVLEHRRASICPSGSIAPEHEAFPTPSSWGKAGWTFSRASHHDPLAAALQRFGLVCHNAVSRMTP
jgi:hypothetical protein